MRVQGWIGNVYTYGFKSPTYIVYYITLSTDKPIWFILHQLIITYHCLVTNPFGLSYIRYLQKSLSNLQKLSNIVSPINIHKTINNHQTINTHQTLKLLGTCLCHRLKRSGPLQLHQSRLPVSTPWNQGMKQYTPSSSPSPSPSLYQVPPLFSLVLRTFSLSFGASQQRQSTHTSCTCAQFLMV